MLFYIFSYLLYQTRDHFPFKVIARDDIFLNVINFSNASRVIQVTDFPITISKDKKANCKSSFGNYIKIIIHKIFLRLTLLFMSNSAQQETFNFCF